MTNDKIGKSDGAWRRELSPDRYRVLRQHGTEPAGTSPLTSSYPCTTTLTVVESGSDIFVGRLYSIFPVFSSFSHF